MKAAKVSLELATRTPGEATRTPGEAARTLGEAARTLGEATRTLGEATRLLGTSVVFTFGLVLYPAPSEVCSYRGVNFT